MDEILELIKQDNAGFDSSNYYSMLLDALPYLKYFQNVRGGEGKAYFLLDKYVIKEYINTADEDLFDSCFEAYCKEMQTFAKEGYLVPQIHAWLKIPQVETRKDKRGIKYKYYILEEQIQGRPLFTGYLEDSYHLCKTLCDEKKFLSVVENPYLDRKLYNEIVRSYVSDFILMNQAIEAMSDADIERFIMTVHDMFDKGVYSVPDMYPSNALYTGTQIVMIDNHFEFKEDTIRLGYTAESFTITGLLFMFLYNENASKLNLSHYFLVEGMHKDMSDLILQNSVVCEQAIRKMIRVAKNCMEKPELKNKKILQTLYQMLKNIIGKSSAKQILLEANLI